MEKNSIFQVTKEDTNGQINDEHNNLRKILNNEFKEAFVEVLNDCIKNSIKFDECIKNSINNNTPSWKDGLIKDDALWKYTDNGKIVKDNTGYYLRKRKYKNEADINLMNMLNS